MQVADQTPAAPHPMAKLRSRSIRTSKRSIKVHAHVFHVTGTHPSRPRGWLVPKCHCSSNSPLWHRRAVEPVSRWKSATFPDDVPKPHHLAAVATKPPFSTPGPPLTPTVSTRVTPDPSDRFSYLLRSLRPTSQWSRPALMFVFPPASWPIVLSPRQEAMLVASYKQLVLRFWAFLREGD